MMMINRRVLPQSVKVGNILIGFGTNPPSNISWEIYTPTCKGSAGPLVQGHTHPALYHRHQLGLYIH